MSTSGQEIRVYNRRSKMAQNSRDWAGLPPKLLEKVFECLELSDLQSAKETCRQWRAHVLGETTDLNEAPAMLSWTDTIDSILLNLQHMNQVKDADIEQIKEFLEQEGFMNAP